MKRYASLLLITVFVGASVLVAPAPAAYITTSMTGSSTINQGSTASFTTTISLHDAAYSGTYYKQDFIWAGNGSAAPYANWSYGDGGSGSGYYIYPRVWGQPLTSPSIHTYYRPGTYTVNESGAVAVAYVNSDSSRWMSGLGVQHFSYSQSKTLTVVNVAPQNLNIYQNGIANTPLTINEGQSITRYMSATDPGLYDSLTFTVNGQSAGTNTTQTTGIRYSNSVSQTYTQDTNGSFVSTGTNRVTDPWSGTSTISASYRVVNVAPMIQSLTLNGANGNITVAEGTSVTAAMRATDPGADALTFYINGTHAGVGGSTPGSTRYSSSVNLGVFTEHNGGFAVNNVTGIVYDDDTSTSISRNINVYNLDPILQSITSSLVVYTGELIDFVALATDPGLDPLSYAWDLNDDGVYDDFFGESGSTSFRLVGDYRISVQVSDGDGGFAYGWFKAGVVPEPASLILWSILGLAGIRFRRRAAAKR